MAEDPRLTAAREYLVEKKYTKGYRIAGDLVTYAEERLRVNQGLLAENQKLKAQAKAPEVVDLASVPTAALLAALAARCSA